MKFDWNDVKAASNLAKHGVEFADAILVFSDPLALYEKDRIADGEQRWQVLGIAGVDALLVVIHKVIEADGDETVRIISARQANRREKKHYERENS